MLDVRQGNNFAGRWTVTINESSPDNNTFFSGNLPYHGSEMTASFCMSDLVSLGDSHIDFFSLLGLPTHAVMTAEQFKRLVLQAEGVLSVMMSDPESDPVLELLTRQILDDLVQHLPVQ